MSADREAVDLDALDRAVGRMPHAPFYEGSGDDLRLMVAAVPSLLAEVRRLRSSIGFIACPDCPGGYPPTDPDADLCRRCGGQGATTHEDVLGELRGLRSHHDCKPGLICHCPYESPGGTAWDGRLRAPAPDLAAAEKLVDTYASAVRSEADGFASDQDRSALLSALSRAPASVGVPADLDEAIEAYRRAAIAEHLTGADRSASIGAQRAAVVTLQDAHDALLAAISRRVPGDLAGLLRRFVAARNEDPTAWRAVATEITEWTRANLPAKEKTDAAE